MTQPQTRAPQATQDRPDPNQNEPQETINILMVDDEPDLADMVQLRMRRQIRNGKYRFVFASDGQDALEILATGSQIDLVVTDINMPRMNGLQLLEYLNISQPNLKSIVVSAYGDLKNIRAAMNSGAFDFVTKPLDFQDLERTIQKTSDHIAHLKVMEHDRDQLRELNTQIDFAAAIQRSILPSVHPSAADYSTHGAMRPAKNVSGDFYDIFPLPGGKLALAIADVSDKGIPASLYMMGTRALLKATANALEQPADVIREVNNLLSFDNVTTMFVTLIYIVYDPQNHTITYCNGGHCNPLIIDQHGQAQALPSTNGVALGLQEELDYRQHTVNLQPGHTLLAFTDGVTEAEDAQANQLGDQALESTFAASPPASAKEAVDLTMLAVKAHAQDTPPNDDATCVAIHRPSL